MTSKPAAQAKRKARSSGHERSLVRAIRDSFRKLDPRTMIKNPVMFVVEVGALSPPSNS